MCAKEAPVVRPYQRLMEEPKMNLTIKNLSLRNFKYHKNLMLTTPKYTVITGVNAAGKTSILEAVTWLFTGRTRRTDGRGAGSDNMILTGQPMALVECTAQGPSEADHVIQRSIPHKLSIDGQGGSIQRTEEVLATLLAPVTQQQLLMLLEDHRILAVSDKERREFFSTAIGITGVNRKVMEEWLLTQSLSDAAVKDVLALYDGMMMKDYRSAYDLRTANNTVLKSLPGGPIAADPGPAPVQSRETLYSRKKILEVERKLAESQVKDGVAFIRRYEIAPIEAQVRKMELIREKLTAEAKALTEKIEEKTNQLNNAQANKEGSLTCPIFNMECSMTGEAREIGIAFMADELKVLEGRKQESDRLLADNQKGIESLQKQLSEVEAINRKYELITENMTVDNIRSKEEIEEDLAKVENLLAMIDAYDAAKTLFVSNQKAVKQYEEAQRKVKALDVLVKGLSPEGATSMLLTAHLRKLEALASDVSRTLTGGKAEVRFSLADGQLDVTLVSEGRERSLKALSTSESIWMSLIIRHILNLYLGNKILVIDEASILDTTMQKGLETFLANDNFYNNIFVCATITDDDPAALEKKLRDFLPALPVEKTRRIHLCKETV